MIILSAEAEQALWSSAMRIVIRPVLEPQRELDVTRRLISAIAEELWRLYGGNEQLNWLEAEQHLRGIVGQTQADAERAAALNAERSAQAGVCVGPRGRRPGTWGADRGGPGIKGRRSVRGRRAPRAVRVAGGT